MSDVPNLQTPPTSRFDWTALTERHFLVAAVLLLAAIISWNTAQEKWKFYLIKMPVVPPATVKVDKKYHVTNFPAKIGSYELVEQSDKPVREDMLEELGTAKNKNNWYYMGLYLDKKANQYVQFSVLYYTGLQDAVPHVGERCAMAAGGSIDYGACGNMPVMCETIPAAWKRAWSKINVYRTVYGTNKGRFVQYHVFSMNGEPTESWEKVRLTLSKPWVKYCYFAKIEIALPVPDLPEKTGDEICQKFLSCALPVVLPYLPTGQDVERAAAQGK